MITIYNIRGTNGSGKSTLARAFIKGDPAAVPNQPGDPNSPLMVDLACYDAPTTQVPLRRRCVEGYCSPSPELDVLVVGSYKNACGGLDTVRFFDTTFRSIERAIKITDQLGTAPERAILAEGVLASTVWSSWGAFAQRVMEQGAVMAFCYLDTPLEVCLERIRKRQEATGRVREIKTELVRDKIRAIAATRRKALAEGHLVYDLPWRNAEAALRLIMTNGPFNQNFRGDVLRAREHYRAKA